MPGPGRARCAGRARVSSVAAGLAPSNPDLLDVLDGHLVGRPVVELGRARALMRGDRLGALERTAIQEIRRDARARKVWQLASPSPTVLARRLIILNTSTRLILRALSPPARGIECHKGESFSAAIPAASR